jgi:hypothetical protein
MKLGLTVLKKTFKTITNRGHGREWEEDGVVEAPSIAVVHLRQVVQHLELPLLLVVVESVISSMEFWKQGKAKKNPEKGPFEFVKFIYLRRKNAILFPVWF